MELARFVRLVLRDLREWLTTSLDLQGFLLHEQRQRLMLTKLNWVDASLFGIQLGVNDIVNETVFFEELLVIQKIITRKDALEEATAPVFIICLFDSLLLVFVLILL